MAAWQDGAWRFYAPQAGWIAFVVDELQLYHFDGSAWPPGRARHHQPPEPDVPRCRHYGGRDELLQHEAQQRAARGQNGRGGRHRRPARQALEGDGGEDRSYLFQTNFSARAEFGLAGDDDFHLKVSPDGAAWTEALLVDRATGTVSLPAGATSVTPAAGTNSTAVATTAFVDAGAIREAGQCRLAKSGSNLVLSRRNGHRIVIGGVVQTIPSAGRLARGGGAYAGHHLLHLRFHERRCDDARGFHDGTCDRWRPPELQIKAGDASRTLVGMARPIAGPAWQDTAKQRFVRSWFNRRREILTNGFHRRPKHVVCNRRRAERGNPAGVSRLAHDTLMTNHSGTIYSNTVPTTAITRHKLDGAATLPLNAYTQTDVAFAG